ncbi:type 4a pilus biogenesis protein PilO [Deinococcus sp. SDU3-2]|uniref:Type 4a pilus biogenesis protein PilO n=1 Tax=Deinococcus terrestris TaxID=2651870 RepID=A0A7X1NW19_9DEIO|nr:type 4a pilus biogenesis protein PilO [Deinococcus terrestris]MPY66856.1 type 4a pilus biogenesis protein PilO [Deinococcus terrestris]
MAKPRLQLSGLAPRTLFLLALAGSALLLTAWYFGRYQTRVQEITLLEGNLETTRLTADRYRAAQRALPELRETVAGLRVERDQFLRALPPTAQFGTVLDEVRRNVLAAGAELSTFAVQSGPGEGLPGGVRPIGLSLGVQGQYAEVFRALRSLETMNRFTTVGGVGLQMPAATSYNPTLEGTLNLTVYTYDPSAAGAAPEGGAAQAPEAPATPAAPAEGGAQ